jgi:hypothetical protein
MKFVLRLATGKGMFLVLSRGVTANQGGWERTSKDLFVRQDKTKIAKTIDVLVGGSFIMVIPATPLTDFGSTADSVG